MPQLPQQNACLLFAVLLFSFFLATQIKMELMPATELEVINVPF